MNIKSENKNSKKISAQVRQELDLRMAQLKAQPVEPEIQASVALRESVADHVYEIMQEQDLTQADLARRLGKSRAHVCKILGGANLTIDTIAALGVALNCQVAIFFEVQELSKKSGLKAAKSDGHAPRSIRRKSSVSAKRKSLKRQAASS